MPLMKRFAFNAKSILTSICLVIFLFTLTSCLMQEDKVLASLEKYEKEEYFTSGGFQDYTDYAKYRCSYEVTLEDGTSSITSFSIYFFDTKSQVLYYFHNNV